MQASEVLPLWAMLVDDRVIGTVEQTSGARTWMGTRAPPDGASDHPAPTLA